METTRLEDYLVQLRKWKQNNEFMKWMTMNQFLMHGYALNQAQINNHPNATAFSHTTSTQQMNEGPEITPQPAAEYYKIPSLKRRFAAEMTDFLLLFSCKMAIVFFLQTIFGLRSFNFQILLLDDINIENFEENHQEEIETMLILAIIYRVVVCLYEWWFLWQYEATPGKKLFNLQVVSCITSTGRHQVVIFPGTKLNLKSAWTRAVVKNLAIAFMIPSFVTALFHLHNRTSYDVLSKTVVVVKNHNLRS